MQYNNYTKLHPSCDPTRASTNMVAATVVSTSVGSADLPVAVAVSGAVPVSQVQVQIDTRRPEHSSFRRASIAAHFIDYLLYLVIHVSAQRRGDTNRPPDT